MEISEDELYKRIDNARIEGALSILKWVESVLMGETDNGAPGVSAVYEFSLRIKDLLKYRK